MKKIILISALIFLFAMPSKADALASVESSAKLMAYEARIEQKPMVDNRVKALKNIFNKYSSPLAEYSGIFVAEADKYGVDWRLLPAISGLESSFGLYLMPESYNGYGWGGGYIYFEDWEDGIATINKTLRENYMDKWNARDVWSIGPIYAESKTWSVRVNSFMNEIEQEYSRLSASTPTI